MTAELETGLPYRRIAITGGPGAGKSTVLAAAMARYPGRVIGVPEVATLMFTHMFPKVHSDAQRRAIQRAIFHTQVSLEDFHGEHGRQPSILLCDRGTPDGGGYWPDGHDAFFSVMQTTRTEELARYDAVLFLESAAVGGLSISAGNPTRLEDLDEAVALDGRLREIWSHHPRYILIPHHVDFRAKIGAALDALAGLVGERFHAPG